MLVVVTGGSGNLGAYVVRELLSAGHEVRVFDRVRPAANVKWVAGDIEDFGDVASVLSGADAVVHLAAIPAPGGFPDNVVFRNNVVGTYNVHEAAALHGIGRVVSTSSTAVYGWAYREREFAPEYLPIDEDHPCNPQDSYGVAKLCLERIAASFTARRDMETIVLRPGRVLLPDDTAELGRQGGQTSTRFDLFQYIDVRDLATAYRQAVEVSLPGNTALNLVADDSTCAEPLCEVLPKLMPEVASMASSLTGTAPGVSNLRAKKALQWQPSHSWRD